MMASRSNVELAKRLKPLLQQIQDMRQSAAERLAGDLGITDVATMRTLLRVHLACLRGLAIDLMFTQDPEDVEQARKLSSITSTRSRALSCRGPVANVARKVKLTPHCKINSRLSKEILKAGQTVSLLSTPG